MQEHTFVHGVCPTPEKVLSTFLNFTNNFWGKPDENKKIFSCTLHKYYNTRTIPDLPLPIRHGFAWLNREVKQGVCVSAEKCIEEIDIQNASVPEESIVNTVIHFLYDHLPSLPELPGFVKIDLW